jgi:SAM-dependent methyltransferase
MTQQTAGCAVGGFTAHNIVLPDGSQTNPQLPVLADGQHAQAALRMALAVCPPVGGRRRPRVVDLGCLEGGFAVEFARAGYDVLGIEARADNYGRCEYVRGQLKLDNLAFVQDDVRNLADYGHFDVAFCSGLLYHLDEPAAFLNLLGKTTTSLLLLHTHYAEIEPNPNYGLSDLTRHEGLEGRWFQEAPTGEWHSREEMEALPWASWCNSTSFWPLKRQLLMAVQRAGFPIVCEQFDALEDIAEDPYTEYHSRSMFAAVKIGR